MDGQAEEELQIEGLPPRPDPATWVAEVPGEPPPDAGGGRDVATETALRYA